MRAQTLPAAAGWNWIPAGFLIFKRNPPMLSSLVVSYWFTVLLLNILPVIGSLAAALVVPGLSVGLMQAARNLDRGIPVGLQTLFGGLKENPRTLVGLGALNLACTMAIVALASQLDDGNLLKYMLANSKAERTLIEDADFTLPILFAMLLMTPVMMAYWFAPVLAAWHRLPLGKSLFFSFIACWINWRAFLVFSVGLLLLAGIVPGVLMGILLMVLPGAPGLVMAAVMVPMALVVAPIIFASFYASYRDIFGISEIV